MNSAHPGASAGAAPDVDASLIVAHGAPVVGRRCRNCEALAERAYCAACGQATALHPPTVREFLHEFLGHYVAFEGPLWRTLKALLLRPGRLTADYFAGRRQRYIGPLRLYLTFSLILFSVNGLRGEHLLLGHDKLQFRIPSDVRGGDVVVFPRTLDGKAGPELLTEKAVQRIEAMTPEQRNARIQAGMRERLPYVLIVLVPVLALLLKLVYWNRKLLYGEHLVVAFHAQTAAFVYALASAVPLGDWFDRTLIVLLGVQGAIALRRVYGGRWWPTLAREATLLVAYGTAVTIAVAALAVASLAL